MINEPLVEFLLRDETEETRNYEVFDKEARELELVSIKQEEGEQLKMLISSKLRQLDPEVQEFFAEILVEKVRHISKYNDGILWFLLQLCKLLDDGRVEQFIISNVLAEIANIVRARNYIAEVRNHAEEIEEIANRFSIHEGTSHNATELGKLLKKAIRYDAEGN